MQYYKNISLKELPENFKPYKPNEKLFSKFVEADEFRKSFSATTWANLKLAERNKTLPADHPLKVFQEPQSKTIMKNVLMVDFYAGIPTLASCIVKKIGQNKATEMIRKSIESEAIIQECQASDNRVKILFPTRKTVNAFENQMAKVSVIEALRVHDHPKTSKAQKLQHSTLVKNLINFDKLRKKHLPKDVFEKSTFELTAILEDTERWGIEHPYLKK